MSQHFRDLTSDISFKFGSTAVVTSKLGDHVYYCWYTFEGHVVRLDYKQDSLEPMQLMFITDEGAEAFDNWVETL